MNFKTFFIVVLVGEEKRKVGPALLGDDGGWLVVARELPSSLTRLPGAPADPPMRLGAAPWQG